MVRRIGRLCLLILITCLEVFVVSGCEGIHLWQYPARDPQVQWVSEKPNMYFAWDEENGGQRGTLIVGENIWLVEVGFRPNCISVLCLSSDNENLIGKVLFDGDCKYGESEIRGQGDGSSVLMKNARNEKSQDEFPKTARKENRPYVSRKR